MEILHPCSHCEVKLKFPGLPEVDTLTRMEIESDNRSIGVARDFPFTLSCFQQNYIRPSRFHIEL